MSGETTKAWRPGPDWQPVKANFEDLRSPTTPKEQQDRFLEYFRSTRWSDDLGPFEQWPKTLKEYTHMALLNPSPVLLCLGPSLRMVYNHSYSCSIGAKQWRILGMRYDEAWEEVWDSIAPFVEKAYKGSVTHVESTRMFLKLGEGEDLEEAYFSWSMIPIVDADGLIQGVYIPNHETTKTILARRRFSTLSKVGHATADAASFREFWDGIIEGLSDEEAQADIPALAIYTVLPIEDDNDLVLRPGEGWPASKEARFQQLRRRASNESNSEEPVDHFTLVTKVPPHSLLPKTLSASLRASAANDTTSDDADSATILKDALHRLRQGEAMVVESGQRARTLFTDQKCTFGDDLKRVVITSIKSSHDEPIQSLILMAVSTRLKLDDDYTRYLSLVATNISAGLATVKLFANRLDQAQYRLWLTSQQSNEMREALEKRTHELLSAEARFTVVASMLPSGLWIADAQGKLVYVNEAWYTISGHPRDAPTDAFIETVHPEDREHAIDVWKTTFSGKVDQTMLLFRWQGKTKEGLERWSTSRAVAERDKNGNVTGVIGIIDDISQQKHVELLEKQRADDAIQRRIRLNRFIDQLSHEVRNPMGAISSCVELVTERLNEYMRTTPSPSSAPVKECLEEMETIDFCLQHMRRLVEETLSVSKIEHDFLTLTFEPFEPLPLVSKTVRMYDAEMASKGIACRISSDEEVDRVWLSSDHARIMQVMINFLSNAIKATARTDGVKEIVVSVRLSKDKPDGEQYRITLGQELADEEDARDTSNIASSAAHLTPSYANGHRHVEPEKVYLEISITDTGDGLDDEQKKKVFQRFSRTLPRTQVSYGVKGHGLGLYISRRIASVLGGACGLVSEVGKGSTFSFFVRADVVEPPPIDDRRPSADIQPLPVTHDAHSTPQQAGSPVMTPEAPVIARRTSLSQGATGPPIIPRRVLVVEDNLVNQKLLVKQLTRRGCIVTTADNGSLCIDVLLKAAGTDAYPNICLLDVEMPVMTGLEASRKIRELEAANALPGRLPLLGVTANTRAEQVEEMIDSGMNAVVSKPFQLDDVLRRMNMLLLS